MSGSVKFTQNQILIKSNGKTNFIIYEDEISTLAFFFENSNIEEQERLMNVKGQKHFSQKQLDSIFMFADDWKSISNHASTKPLEGYRIAIDPGHFAVSFPEADIEQKFLYFVKDSLLFPNDSIKLFESALTFNTAQLVKLMLEEEGAEVLLTRNQNNFTSFNCTYTHWMATHKQRVLDSLLAFQKITKDTYKQLVKYKEKKFFWDFYRDFDLKNRAHIMNAFHPHLSIVIHYNVDEKNEPWKQVTKKNYTMGFIPGVFNSETFSKRETTYNFLRLLLTNQLERSEELAAYAVSNFSQKLNIPLAQAQDASYLNESCLPAKSPGVFSRNLMLCRKINSPLVYGESLYQDNEKEAEALMKLDIVYKGISTNTRVLEVARAYFDAVKKFAENN